MKPLLPLLRRLFIMALTAGIISSCASYQYTSLTSSLPIDSQNRVFYKDEKGIRAEFSFSGKQMPIQCKIYNNSGHGIYLDLSSSVFILNGRVVGNMKKKETANLRLYSEDREIFNHEYTRSTGTVSVQKAIDFVYIPTEAYIQMSFQIFNPVYSKRGKERSNFQEVKTQNGYTVRYKTYQPKEGNQYEIALAFSETKTFDEIWSLRSVFQEENYYYTTSVNQHFQDMPNVFYVENTSGKRAAGTILLVGLVGVGIYAAATNEDGN